MSKLTITKPEIGKPDATEDVKLVNALTAIETWANGQIDSTNLKGEGVETAAVKNENITKGKLSKELQELLATTFSVYVSWGLIAEAGTITTGSGNFTAAKIGTGEYEIKWTAEKEHAGYAVVAMCSNSTSAHVLTLKERTKTLFKLLAWNETVRANTEFMFVVIGIS